MLCEGCNGRGQIRYFGACVECPDCFGHGGEHITLAAMNGLLVRVIDTGFIGICNVTGDGRAIVINDEDEEVEDLTVEDLELLDGKR